MFESGLFVATKESFVTATKGHAFFIILFTKTGLIAHGVFAIPVILISSILNVVKEPVAGCLNRIFKFELATKFVDVVNKFQDVDVGLE